MSVKYKHTEPPDKYARDNTIRTFEPLFLRSDAPPAFGYVDIQPLSS